MPGVRTITGSMSDARMRLPHACEMSLPSGACVTTAREQRHCYSACFTSVLTAQRWGVHQRRCRLTGRGTLQSEADPDDRHNCSFRASSRWQRAKHRKRRKQWRPCH